MRESVLSNSSFKGTDQKSDSIGLRATVVIEVLVPEVFSPLICRYKNVFQNCIYVQILKHIADAIFLLDSLIGGDFSAGSWVM